MLQNLLKISQSIFSNFKVTSTEGKCEEALTRFKSLFSQLTLEDIHLTPEKLGLNNGLRNPLISSPISYMNVFENEYFSLTVFGLRKPSIIPLHDHPEMNAFLRCVYGSVSVKSYSILKNVQIPKSILTQVNGMYHQHIGNFSFIMLNLSTNFFIIVPAILSCDEVLSSDNLQIGTLSPDEKNIHEVLPITETAVLADIITPPYTTSTNSFYYEVIDTTFDSKLNKSVTWLFKTPDSNYYCKNYIYTGPVLNV